MKEGIPIQRIWNDLLVTVWEPNRVSVVAGSTFISGLARKGTRLYSWTAQVQPSGWYTEVTPDGAYRPEGFQGSTFNLPLEVATAVRRTQ